MDSENQMSSLFSFDSFNGMNGVTHLKISFPLHSTIDERVLTNIDINLPNLQLLGINSEIKTDLKGYQVIADRLSRLSKLRKLNVRVTARELSIEEMFETKLMKNWPKIIWLDFRSVILALFVKSYSNCLSDY